MTPRSPHHGKRGDFIVTEAIHSQSMNFRQRETLVRL